MGAPATNTSQLRAANADAAEFFRRELLGPEGAGPREYLVARGFGGLLQDTRWTVGYAPPGWTRLQDHLASLGYSEAAMHEAGLACRTRQGDSTDLFRDRIVFGIRDQAGTPVAFVGRKAPTALAKVPKYLNTRSTLIYDKGRTLFGLSELRSSTPSMTVVSEGPLDAIAFDMACGANTDVASIATCGTALSRHQATMITKLDSSAVALAFDPDSAGNRARASAYRLLPDVPHLWAWRSPDGSDPAQLLAAKGAASLKASIECGGELVADAIIDHHFDSWPPTKTGAEADLCLLREALASVRDLHTKDVARQVARIARRLGTPYEEVTYELLHSKTDAGALGAAIRGERYRVPPLRRLQH